VSLVRLILPRSPRSTPFPYTTLFRSGARIVCVDPRVTRTSHQLADEHIFIRPSTDAAALIAMAYVIVTEGLHDQAFLDRHVLGRSEEHTSELQSLRHLVCRLLLEKKN